GASMSRRCFIPVSPVYRRDGITLTVVWECAVMRAVSADSTPRAYRLGIAPFMGHEFYSEPGTMYPREVSAILVSTVVDLVSSGALVPAAGEPLRLIDQCGGSA